MRRPYARALVHFLLGGTLLFVGVRTWRVFGDRGVGVTPVVLTAQDVAHIRRQYTRDTGADASSKDEAGLVERAIEDELLFREALARGLDRDRSVRNWLVEQLRALEPDTTAGPDELYESARALELDRTDSVVRRMLVQKMRLLAARENEQPPTDAVLQAYYEQHADEYRTTERLTLWHVFLARATEVDATQFLGEIHRDNIAPATAALRGDTFAAPSHLRAQSAHDLSRYFGPAFAGALRNLPTSTWAGPIASPYGVHLVWIEQRTPAGVPALDEVRGQIRERWLHEQRAKRLEDLLQVLKTRHPLHVESAAWLERSST